MSLPNICRDWKQFSFKIIINGTATTWPSCCWCSSLVVITAADSHRGANKYPELCVTLIHLYMHLFPNYCWDVFHFKKVTNEVIKPSQKSLCLINHFHSLPHPGSFFLIPSQEQTVTRVLIHSVISTEILWTAFLLELYLSHSLLSFSPPSPSTVACWHTALSSNLKARWWWHSSCGSSALCEQWVNGRRIGRRSFSTVLNLTSLRQLMSNTGSSPLPVGKTLCSKHLQNKSWRKR